MRTGAEQKDPGFVNALLRLRTAALLAAFTLADLLAGFLNALHEKGHLPSRFFRLARDRGFAELIQYGKFVLVILMLMQWNRRRRSTLLAAWVLLFSVMLVDDAVGLHEAIGGALMRVIEIPDWGGVRIKDLAEFGSFAFVEGSVCLYVLFRHIQAPADLRAYSWGLALALAPLLLIGVLLDILPFHTLEQPGEMVAMSILLGFVHWTCRRRAPQR
jgi:hypothetical protein